MCVPYSNNPRSFHPQITWPAITKALAQRTHEWVVTVVSVIEAYTGTTALASTFQPYLAIATSECPAHEQ